MNTILIADDDEMQRKILAEKFHASGWEPIPAADGEDALRLIRERTFDIILLDLRMPKKSGFEVLEAIKGDSALGHPVILVLSSSKEDDDVQRAIALGATDYFIKTDDSLENIFKWASVYAGVIEKKAVS